MVELTRTVRFCLSDAGPPDVTQGQGYAGRPAMQGLGRYYELHVTCRGDIDPVSGYFLNITHIDHAVREHVIPALARRIAAGAAHAPMGTVLREIYDLLQPPLSGSVTAVCLQLTPYHRLTLRGAAMGQATLRQRYEFSAAHRLHAPSLSAAENHKLFGKCNNPAGHGHNYLLDVSLAAPIDPAGRTLDLAAVDAVVEQAVIARLDHKHLNVDVEPFRTLNPTVENIAVVVHGWLAPALARLGATLEEISLWETEKTVCTYRGE